MLKIYTDGSSLGNPGPGGWGVVIITDEQLLITNENSKNKKQELKNKSIELGGYEKNTTNNRMELTAVIEALKYLSARKVLAEVVLAEVEIYTDSAYVLGGVTSWIKNWERNGWRTANKKEVLNQDLWKKLDELINNFSGKISWQKVKGHSGHIYNDRADEIATNFASKINSGNI